MQAHSAQDKGEAKMKQEKASQPIRNKSTLIPAGQEETQERELSADEMEKVSGGTQAIPPEWDMRDDYP